MKSEKIPFKDDDFPEIQIGEDLTESHNHDLPFRLTREEAEAVASSNLLNSIFGKKTVRNVIIYGFSGITLVLLITGFWAAGISVKGTITVYKQSCWIQGQPSAMRIAYIDDTEGYIPLKRASIKLRRSEPLEEAIIYDGNLPPAFASSIVAHPPPWPDGRYLMTVSVETEKSKKKAVFNVTLNRNCPGSKYSPCFTDEVTGNEQFNLIYRDYATGITVELLPENYVLASSLHNVVFVRTTDKSGNPISARINLKLVQGYIQGDIPSELKTDAAGIGAFMVYPAFNVMAIKVSVSDEKIEFKDSISDGGIINLPVAPRVFRLRSVAPYITSGGKINLHIYTISRNSPFYLDVYRNGLWKDAISGYLNSFSLPVSMEREEEPGLISLQVYGDPSYIGKAAGSIHLWLQEKGERIEDSIKKISKILIKEGIDTHFAQIVSGDNFSLEGVNAERLMAFLLSRLDRGYYPPEIFYTTRKDDEKAVSLLKEKIKRAVIISMSCGAGIFTLAVILMLLLAFKARSPVVEEFEKKSIYGVEEIEDWKGKRVTVSKTPPIEEIEKTGHLLHTGWGAGTGMGTRRFFILLSMAAAVMAMFFGMLAILFTLIKWSFSF